MLGTLFVLFILLPALDLFLLLQLGQWLGIYQTLILIIATGFAGAVLYRTQSWLNLRRIQQAVSEGRMPDTEIIDSLLIIGGALLLVTPGVLTDFFGFLILLPFTRPLVRKAVIWWFKRNVTGSVSIQVG